MEWSRQEQELRDTEIGVRFLEIVDFWTAAAEGILTRSWTIVSDDHPEGSQDVTGAFRGAFLAVEDKFGHITIHWMGQLMVVIIQWWERGEELQKGLTVFESRIVEEALHRKLTELVEMAKPPPELNDHDH